MAILDHRQPPRLRLARRRPADQNGEEDEGQDGPGDDKDDWQVHGQLVSASIAGGRDGALKTRPHRSEEHTSELQSLMRISYAVFCLKKKKHTNIQHQT